MRIVVIDYIGIIVGLLIFRTQIFLRPKAFRIIRYIAVIALVSVIVVLLYYSYVQYRFWQSNDLTRGFLPSHRSINYFLLYVVLRFFMQYIVSFVVGALAGAVALVLNKRFGEAFLEREEPYLIFLMIFLTAHPFWMLSLAGALCLAILLAIFYRVFKKYKDKVPLYYVWAPTMILVLILKSPLLNIYLFRSGFYNLLKF